MGKKIESKGKMATMATTPVPIVQFDPKYQTTVNNKVIEIPDPAYKVESLLQARKSDFVHEDPDEEDLAIFQLDLSKRVSHPSQHDLDDEDDYHVQVASTSKVSGPVQRVKDDWKHDADYVNATLENLMLPPFQSSPSASMAIQRELKAMLKEQEMAPCLRDLGWYMPPELIGDNLYQWIVEVHSLDPELPISKDMQRR